jgi:hypothetical protein
MCSRNSCLVRSFVLKTPRIAAVRIWLRAEAAQYEQELEDLAPPSVLRP